MKKLYCINNWTKDPDCCTGERGSNLFMGVKITDGLNTFWHEYPFRVRISKGKMIFTFPDRTSVFYYTGEFTTQTEGQLMELLLKCQTGSYDNTLVPKPPLTYVVDGGDQQTFLVPKETDESYLPIEYYSVYKDGELLETGTDEFQYVLDGGDVFFTVPIPDITPGNDPYVISIEYWVKK